MIESLATLMKSYPKATLTVVAGVALAAIQFGRWIDHAELCHQKAEIAVEGLATVTRLHEDELLRKRATNEKIAELCRSGELRTPVTCAKAGAPIAPE